MEQWINRSNDGCTFHRKDSCVGIRGACYFLHARSRNEKKKQQATSIRNTTSTPQVSQQRS